MAWKVAQVVKKVRINLAVVPEQVTEHFGVDVKLFRYSYSGFL